MAVSISDSGIQFASGIVQATPAEPAIFPVTASVAASALTITLNTCCIAFRNTSLSTGGATYVNVNSAVSMTVSSGSTLGTVSTIAARLAIIAINNAGTVELAIANLSGGVALTEDTLISTTAEGGAGAADSATVVYSTTARTNVTYRIVGYIDITQATAGTWATAPSLIQGVGGNSRINMQSLGYGQTWQDVTVSRAHGTTYYNTTGRPITVSGYSTNGTGQNLASIVNGYTITTANWDSNSRGYFHFVVPPGASYSVSLSSGTSTLNKWSELR